MKENHDYMNILQICANYPPVASGYGIYAQNLSLELTKYGVKTIVLTFKPNNNNNNDDAQGLLNIKRINAFNIKSIEFPIFYPTILYHIHKIVKENDIEVINSHTRFFTSTYFASLYKIINKDVIFCHTEHGAGELVHKSRLVSLICNKYDSTFGKWAIKAADIPIAIGPTSKNYLEKLGCKKDIEIIPNSVNFTQFQKRAKESVLIKQEEIIITFIGRLVESKGVSDLIKAFSRIEKDFNVKLWIVGSGPDENKLKFLAKKLNISKIEFLGFRLDIAEILNITDIFVNPSYYDSVPTTVLEACCLGIRVVSTNVGDIPFILGENYNYLYNIGYINILEKHIRDIIEKSDFNAQYLEKRIETHFNWEINARKYISILENKKKVIFTPKL